MAPSFVIDVKEIPIEKIQRGAFLCVDVKLRAIASVVEGIETYCLRVFEVRVGMATSLGVVASLVVCYEDVEVGGDVLLPC